MDIYKILQQEINRIASTQTGQAIFLVGSAVDAVDMEIIDLEKIKDIDIFVITPGENHFQREVLEKEGIKFDISYLPLDLLKKGIQEKWALVISVLAKAKLIYGENQEIIRLVKEISNIYLSGPGPLTQEEMKYIRFKLYQDYEDILYRKSDHSIVKFLAYNLFREILVTYFKLNEKWVPKDKKILKIIKKEEQMLYNLCNQFLEEENTEKILQILLTILEYVLNPFGGVLRYWPKGKFPLI
jgi:hypothetical protein